VAKLVINHWLTEGKECKLPILDSYDGSTVDSCVPLHSWHSQHRSSGKWHHVLWVKELLPFRGTKCLHRHIFLGYPEDGGTKNLRNIGNYLFTNRHTVYSINWGVIMKTGVKKMKSTIEGDFFGNIFHLNPHRRFFFNFPW